MSALIKVFIELGFILSLLIFWLVYKLISGTAGFISSGDDDSSEEERRSRRQYANSYDYSFREALLVILAAEMNADGRVTRAELNVVKQVLVAQFGEYQAKEALLELRDILKTRQSVRAAAVSIWRTVGYTDRLRIVSILCDIADADGIVTQEEVNTIVHIATYMGVSQYDLQMLIGRLNINGDQRYYDNSYTGGGGSASSYSEPSLAQAYSSLGVSQDATNAEVKAAYKKLAMKYHPDRVATDGEEAVEEAEKKFKEIQAAYEKIKMARGLK